MRSCRVRSSHMRMRVSPDISIGFGVRVKVPGERMVGQDVELSLKSHAVDEMPPYQRLLGDAMRGNGELFARQDLVEAQWRIVQPILDNVTPVYAYRAGHVGSGRNQSSSSAPMGRGSIPCRRQPRIVPQPPPNERQQSFQVESSGPARCAAQK